MMTTTAAGTKRLPLRVQIRADELLKAGQARSLEGALLKAWCEDQDKKQAALRAKSV